ncbi:MAG: LytTR family transcriptional regulator DNA-binding domain-containing protein [Desemzia incerta]
MHTLIVDDEPLARNELTYLLRQCPEIISIKEAETIEEAVGHLIEGPIELIFLDIHLTEESGLTLADKLSRLEHPPIIIFATAYDEYALQAFELNARDYVLKPFSLERVQQAVRKAAQTHRATQSSAKERVFEHPDVGTIPVQVEDRIFLLKVDSIVAVSVQHGEVSLYTDNKDYTLSGTLNTWEEQLSMYGLFLRVHRSFLINTAKIKEIQPWFNHTFQLTMSNQLKVPVSRSYMKEFKEKIGLT